MSEKDKEKNSERLRRKNKSNWETKKRERECVCVRKRWAMGNMRSSGKKSYNHFRHTPFLESTVSSATKSEQLLWTVPWGWVKMEQSYPIRALPETARSRGVNSSASTPQPCSFELNQMDGGRNKGWAAAVHPHPTPNTHTHTHTSPPRPPHANSYQMSLNMCYRKSFFCSNSRAIPQIL